LVLAGERLQPLGHLSVSLYDLGLLLSIDAFDC
jgi:hypothetical protein